MIPPDIRQQLERQGFRFPGVVLGEGGFGCVEQATFQEMERAVKVSKDPLEQSPTLQNELDRLAHYKQLTQHPFLLTMVGYQVLPVEWDGNTWRFLVTIWELARQSLHQRLKECPQGIEASELLGYMRDIAEALDYLHAHQIHHRDIKPPNLFCFEDGHARLGDFGLAKLIGLSQTGTVAGTLGYMSPEIAATGKSHATSDLFSLAATYLELRTGRRSQTSRNPDGTFDLTGLNPGETTAVSQALNISPQNRPQQGAKAWVDQLENAFRNLKVATPTVATPPGIPLSSPNSSPDGVTPPVVKELNDPLSIPSVLKRLENLQPQGRLDRIIFLIGMPNGDSPSSTLTHGERCLKVVEWAISPDGPGLDAIQNELG